MLHMGLENLFVSSCAFHKLRLRSWYYGPGLFDTQQIVES